MFTLASPEVQFAAQAVRQAALLVRQVQAEMTSQALRKADSSPVTVADFASQALVGRLLAEAFPRDVLVAEESSAALQQEAQLLEAVTGFTRRHTPQAEPQAVCAWIDRGAGAPAARFWTLDPIDGTKGFLRRDQYVVALALLVDYRVQVAALGCPNLEQARYPSLEGPGSLVIACRGAGTWTTSLEAPAGYQRLQVSLLAEAARMLMMRSFEAEHTNVSLVDQFARRLQVQREPLRMDSQAKFAMIAAGAGELLLRPLPAGQPWYRTYLWDLAAGALVVEEAGGRVSDLDGKELDFSRGRRLEHNRGVVVSNGVLHPAILEAIADVGI